MSSPRSEFEVQLQSLLKQQKYRQALDAIHKVQRSQPDWVFKPSEAEIWLLRGKQEFEKGDFRQAETSLRRSLQLGVTGEAHYWLAKSLLALNRLDAALTLIQEAFADGSLPKDYSICYPKLLLLKGDTVTVEQVLNQHPKRFSAAQQHWLQGALALKAQQPEGALSEFQKVKRPVTPGDRPNIWQIYTQQALHHWEAAALQLGLGMKTNTLMGLSLGRPAYTEHPILQRFALMQQLETGHPPLEQMQFSLNQGISNDLVTVLSLVELINENNPHDAAHALLNLDRPSNQFPELTTLRPALLTLAGQQALMQGEIGCAAEFWQRLHREQDFNPQLAVNLVKVLDLNEDYQDLQRLLTRIIKWLEQDLKRHPQNWTPDRHKAALVYAHCRLADTWMGMGRSRAGLGELRTAERLDPRSPEVIGRHGLLAALDENYDEAIRLLTESLEGGCRSMEVYTVLIDTWKTLGNSEAAAETRRRFGKTFGDLNPEAEVELLPWVSALATQNYALCRRLVQEGSDRDPAMRACQIFVEAAQGDPTPGGKISLNQTQAVQHWDSLLQGLSAKEQVPTLQAIALSMLLFAKREKGIAALITQYLLNVFELGDRQPEARTAHLVLLAVKERDPKKLETPLQLYLGSQPQPGNALAQIQLQVRLYTQSSPQHSTLRSFLNAALQKEPQNPLLLLAKATTYPTNSPTYDELKQQGFEIARRLQDAKALQAFRQEESFLNARMTQEFLPDPDALDHFDMEDMDELLETMIRKMVGNKIPASELKRMLPQLKQMMMNDLPPNFGDQGDEEDEFGFGFPFSPPPARRSAKRRKRR
ncbi:MAG: tetratricopeptide repeat protein [Leptolyngbyaceae cyanobacterium RU_5_1]|nr:tetratricopeptide repeat protein [Leptolyngbyaceae cyanobacterium RU_5_1]